MNNVINRLNDIKIENNIWVIYIIIIILSWYANSKEKNYFLTNNDKSKKEYQNIMIFIFVVLLFIYYYFLKDSYDDMQNLRPCDSSKKKFLVSASYIGSLLIFLSGIIFLIIAISDDNIDVELAFN